MKKTTDAIGFRMVYRNLVLSHSLTTIFRPDNPKYKELYCCGPIVEGRIITEPGNSRLNINPAYTDDAVYLKAKSVRRIALQDLKPEDFIGSSPDIQNVQELIYHLGMIYNKPAEEFMPDTKVIRIELEYVNLKEETDENR